MNNNDNNSIIKKTYDILNRILPGGDRINIIQKFIFLFFIFALLRFININLFNSIPDNLKTKVSLFINTNILNYFSVILVLVGCFYSIALTIQSIGFRCNWFDDNNKHIVSYELGRFLKWILNYFTLYIIIWFCFTDIDYNSLLISIKDSGFNFFLLLTIVRWIITIWLIAYLLRKILYRIFVSDSHLDRDYNHESKKEIAKNILAHMTKEIKAKNLNYIEQKEKALKIIKSEIELFEHGIDIEKIEKEIKECGKN